MGGEHNIYQWYKDIVLIPGAQNDTLILKKAELSDAGTYSCQITNSVATLLTLSSQPFVISVLERPHFNPVWSGNGFDHMNFYVLTATYDGQDMQPGDEIGIFDGEICVGGGTLTEVLVDGVNYLSVLVSKDDPGTPEIDGYIPGHTAIIQIVG